MLTWKKCSKRHIYSDRYDYFLQCPRQTTGLLAKVIWYLESKYGKSETKENLPKDHWAGYRMIPNKIWYKDRLRKRLYITEQALLIYNLTQYAQNEK